MPTYLYALDRAASLDRTDVCPHCREPRAHEAFHLVGATALGRFFRAISPNTPVLRCTTCGGASQHLSTAGKLLVALSWAPMTVLLLALAGYVWTERAVNDSAPEVFRLLLGLSAGAAAVTAYMLYRVFSRPLYPIAGRAIPDGERLYFGR